MQSIEFAAFDTVVSISADVEVAVLDECQALCARYEHLLSRFDETGPLWRLNHAGGKRVALPDELARFLETALGYCERSEGRFDITMGSVCKLWDFHTGVVPGQEAVAEALQHVDWRGIHVLGNEAWLDDPQAWIDLGGIAKGYIADEIVAYLCGAGAARGIVNLGGNVFALGEKEDGRPWRIGIRAPQRRDSGNEKPVAVVEVRDKSVVTSGTYERAFEKDGAVYHHILDPRTGFPVVTDLVSATVISSRSIDGDGYSTTLLALGREGALRFAAAHPEIEVVLVTTTGEVVYPRAEKPCGRCF